jgi:hypothetical protein
MPALSKKNMELGSKLSALCIPYVGLQAGRCQEMNVEVYCLPSGIDPTPRSYEQLVENRIRICVMSMAGFPESGWQQQLSSENLPMQPEA